MGRKERKADEEQLRRIARSREREMPGETAGGRIDPRTVPNHPRQTSGHGPSGTVRGGGDLPRGGMAAPMGDESTGGQAAREATGVDPRAERDTDKETGWAAGDEVDIDEDE